MSIRGKMRTKFLHTVFFIIIMVRMRSIERSRKHQITFHQQAAGAGSGRQIVPSCPAVETASQSTIRLMPVARW